MLEVLEDCIRMDDSIDGVRNLTPNVQLQWI